jgi:pantothenate kinase type III
MQFGYNQLRDQIADQQWQSQFDYAQNRDQVADNQWQTEHDFMVKQQEYENKFNGITEGTLSDSVLVSGATISSTAVKLATADVFAAFNSINNGGEQ